jgi:hypothetical protein
MAAPKVVVLDGEHAVTKLATDLWPRVPQQRCWWHLCRAFRWALYADKAPSPWAKDRRAELLALLQAAIANQRSTQDALRLYDDFVDAIDGAGHHAATSLLTVARPQVFTCLDPKLRAHLAYLGGPEIRSGVIERTMRDINARVDIGGSRWTIPGIRDTITVLTARRFHHPAWTALTNNLRPTNTIPFDLAKFNAG